ncbi:MAG TPA: OadG family protein [Thermovirgaceae bacterium]|nr:OadG family protein [Thermovirgaceae bacterium]
MELSHIADKFSHGLGGAFALAMIAFSIVFLVLMALTFIIMGTRYLADLSEGKKQTPKTPQAQQAAATSGAAPQASAGTDRNVIAAVIAAAIAASGGGRAISVRPLTVSNRGKSSAWKTAGRMDLLEGFE